MQSKEQEIAQSAGAAAPGSSADTDMDLGDVIAFFSASWRSICLWAGLCGLLYGFWAWQTVPVLYQSKVTMVLPAVSRYSAQGFQKLLESDTVVDQTLSELRGTGVCTTEDQLAIGDDLKTALQLAPQGNIVPSTLEALVLYRDRDKAAAIATAWVAVFARKVREAAGANPAMVLEQDFLATSKALAASESKQTQLEESAATRELELQAKGDSELTKHHQACTEALRQFLRDYAKQAAAKDGENRVALAELQRGRPSLDWEKDQLENLQKVELALRQEQGKIAEDLQARLMEIEKLTLEMAHVPQFLSVRKSATEEPAAHAQPGGGEKPPVGGVVSQEINPLYTELSAYLARLRTEAEPQTMRAKQVAENLKFTREEGVALDRTIQTDEAALNAIDRTHTQALLLLQSERDAGRKALEQQQGMEEARIKAETAIAVENLRRETKAQLAPLAREVAQQTDLYAQLSKVMNQAKVETTQQGAGEVQVVRTALPAARPLSRNLVLRALGAMFIGAVLGTLFALVRRPLRPA